MPIASPKLDRRLRDAALACDDECQPFAETWRVVGGLADEIGLVRPGYDTIRLLLRRHRRDRAEVRELLSPVVADLLQGRFSGWDVERVSRAAEIRRRGR
jgi:hypothetical protein